jgi:hypothetical protein
MQTKIIHTDQQGNVTITPFEYTPHAAKTLERYLGITSIFEGLTVCSIQFKAEYKFTCK